MIDRIKHVLRDLPVDVYMTDTCPGSVLTVESIDHDHARTAKRRLKDWSGVSAIETEKVADGYGGWEHHFYIYIQRAQP